MKSACTELSIVTNKYLLCFHRILDNMIYGMTTAQLTDSISHNFITQMIPHHRAAIEMSENLLCYTTCIPLQEIALGIIREQTKSIRDMQQILCCCGRLQNTAQELCLYQNRVHEITQTMFTEMKDACTVNDINVTFMNEMIPHHKGAIRMSQNALSFPICPDLTPILDAIIISQQQGVREMEALLSELRGKCPD